MARKSRQDTTEETRLRLVAAARQVFVKNGYADTAMEDLTSAAGLTRGALYHHFGDKKGLLKAVAQDIEIEMDERLLAAAHQAQNTWAGLQRRCHLYLEMALEPDVQRIVLRDAPALLGLSYTEECQRSCVASLARVLQELMQEQIIHKGDPEMLARVLNGGLVHAALWISSEEDPRARLESAITTIDTLLSGLKTTGSHTPQ
ncbi:Transcriptional regulator, TetR family [Tritonibacter mobilis]|uniref:TetR/AcrR family transcriptional regulator n=1 Tax=Tritonibacter mobilis TaxID=379347 RepID=UPI000F6FFB0B|nr:TetR/AcrR family transcriptional regulator [Tritonibacter mobilis]VCU61245.1 Transcriptional regulator, TetR family [Tritonibacter mobilis]